MAASKKSFADGFTVDSLLGGSNTPPISNQANTGSGSVPGSGKGYKGAPTLYSVDRGEKTLKASGASIYPPVYGGGNRQVTITKATRPSANGGYNPSSSDITNSPTSN